MAALSPAMPARTATVCILYLSPTGSDANSGTSVTSPLKTLAGAQARIQQLRPQVDVEIRIKQGTYVAPQLTWNTYVQGHTISFMPVDYQPGDSASDIAGRPIFHGDGTSGRWLLAKSPTGTWIGGTNLRFYYLQVEHYDIGGLGLGGSIGASHVCLPSGICHILHFPTGTAVNNNTVYGMNFFNIGTRYVSGLTDFGTEAILVQNSSGNLIRNNHFMNLVNDGHLGEIHGLYVAHYSNHNTIVANDFRSISGDPVRIRNYSNDNVAEDNTFDHTGRSAFYSDWFCDDACLQAHPDHSAECGSHGNIFRNNDTGGKIGFKGSRISLFQYFPPEEDGVGPLPFCSTQGEPRLSTAGNT